MRIAMWSGPRNLSTALMYSFGARADCAVVDEPFYASYLADTGLDHPMREAILASQAQDPTMVAHDLVSAIPDGVPHLYMKLMTHHMGRVMPRMWMRDVTNVFLIRHPARVIASYAAKREAPTLDDLGFRQQAELFDLAHALGQAPVVIDSTDIRADPAAMLRKLCAAIDLDFDPAMLRWPAGGHPADGVWAAHWYGAVHRSTGFAGPEGPLPEVPEASRDLLDRAMPIYDHMRGAALTLG
ncbi:MAG: HAD family hydrolase [Rhodobacteraceae bacterium]|nr:HAD family hydrolase [Paracoccaceae bacterium]